MNEEKARKILHSYIDESNRLLIWVFGECHDYMYWKIGDEHVTLDGTYTIETLEAIIWWVKNHKK